jgi:hypothetical protein
MANGLNIIFDKGPLPKKRRTFDAAAPNSGGGGGDRPPLTIRTHPRGNTAPGPSPQGSSSHGRPDQVKGE